MSKSTLPLLEFHATCLFNREAFLLNHPAIFQAFSIIDDNFGRLLDPLIHQQDKDGHSHVSLGPMLTLMQRQCRVAFELLMTGQSYQSWVLLRPCLEFGLIIGKWVDDPKNATVWERRRSDPKRYRQEYSGTHLQSKSLPRSDDLRGVLSQINDDYMHANESYYSRHMSMSQCDSNTLKVKVSYLDSNVDQEAHVYAVLHLLLVLQNSLAELLVELFPGVDQIDIGLTNFEEKYQQRAQEIMRGRNEHMQTLTKLGLW